MSACTRRIPSCSNRELSRTQSNRGLEAETFLMSSRQSQLHGKGGEYMLIASVNETCCATFVKCHLVNSKQTNPEFVANEFQYHHNSSILPCYPSQKQHRLAITNTSEIRLSTLVKFEPHSITDWSSIVSSCVTCTKLKIRRNLGRSRRQPTIF